MATGTKAGLHLKTIANVHIIAAHNLRPQASAYGTSKLAVLKLAEFLLVEAAVRVAGVLCAPV